MFAVQPHREVGPGSWLVKAYRITTPFWAESGKEGKREHGGCCIVVGGGEGEGLCSLLDHTHQLAVTAHEPDAPGQGPALSAGCSRRLPSPWSIPHVGVLLGKRIREEVGLKGGGLLVLSSRTVR